MAPGAPAGAAARTASGRCELTPGPDGHLTDRRTATRRGAGWHDDAMHVPRARLVGRTAELASLRQARDAACRGEGGAVVVAGEAGIGKTRLLEELLAAPPESDGESEGALVLRGQCAESGTGPVPYAGLEGILRDAVQLLGAEATLEAAGPAADALGVLSPGLVEVRSGADTGRLPEALTDLLVGLSRRRPLVVVLEDLHWSDDATRACLARLARVAPRAGLLLLASYRSDDVGRRHPLRAALAELERARLVTRIDLGRLRTDEVVQLALDLLEAAEPGTAVDGLEDLVERSEGVPFYVEELATVVGGAMPESLREVLLLRYSQLSPRAQEFCRAVAAAGRRAPHDLLTAVLTEDRLAAAEGAAREAVDALVLRADADGYQFRHALMQEAVAAELLPGERRRLHTAYAIALEAGPSSVARLAQVADHWWAARVPDRALTAAVVAQAAAEREGATSTAVALGERALDLWDLVRDPESATGIVHAELLRHVAIAVHGSTQLDRAVALARQALREWPEDDPAGRARALGTVCGFFFPSDVPGDLPDATGTTSTLDDALASLPEDAVAARTDLLMWKSRAAMLAGRLEEAVRAADEGYTVAMEAGDRSTASILVNIATMARVTSGDIDALEQMARARELAGEEWRPLTRYYTNFSDALLTLGEYSRALEVASEGAARARERGAGWASRAMLKGNVAEAWLGLGRWDEADAWYEASVPLVAPSAFAVYLHERWTWLTFWRGDVERAQTMARRQRQIWIRHARNEMQIRSRTAVTLTELALERGDLDDALELVADVLVPDRLAGKYALPVLAVAAKVLARAREEGRDVALEPYREVLGRAVRWPTGPVHAALFAAELGEGPWLAVREAQPAPAYVAPYALSREGADLLARGDRDAARGRLTEAVAAARRISCGLVADRAEALLASAGAAAPARTTAEDQRTDRERQVLALVAEGMTNGQIAERLFISRKTASVHVSAILRKLGVASRTEAALRASPSVRDAAG